MSFPSYRNAAVALYPSIDRLTDPAALTPLLGPVSRVRIEPVPSVGFSNSLHQRVFADLERGGVARLRIKRTHVGEDWIARLIRERPPGREISLLLEPDLADVWLSFWRSHLAAAVEGSEAALLMEDHGEALLPDVREPISVEAEETLLSALASLHARFWDSPVLKLPWLAQPRYALDLVGPRHLDDPAGLAGAPESIREGVIRGWREALRFLPVPVAERLVRPAEELCAAWDGLPRTLIHGDAKVANFAFLPDRCVAAFDWSGIGAAPVGVEVGWYLAVNSTRLARAKDQVLARYRALLESKLGFRLEDPLWTRLEDVAALSGARMMLWSKALALQEGSAFRRDDWSWWVSRLTAWCSR